jgi:hypothetical protein
MRAEHKPHQQNVPYRLLGGYRRDDPLRFRKPQVLRLSKVKEFIS